MSPAATTELSGEHITARGDTDLSTRNGQRRFLVRELGVTQKQAHALIRAYELDQRDGQARDASHDEFGGWLRSNYWRAMRGGLFATA